MNNNLNIFKNSAIFYRCIISHMTEAINKNWVTRWDTNKKELITSPVVMPEDIILFDMRKNNEDFTPIKVSNIDLSYIFMIADKIQKHDPDGFNKIMTRE